MTQLRDRMLEELERRNYAPGTAKAYLFAVKQFAEHFHRPPDRLGAEHIREYQLYQDGVATSPEFAAGRLQERECLDNAALWLYEWKKQGMIDRN